VIGYIIVFFVLFVVFVAMPFGIVMIILSLHFNRRERNLRNEAEAHRKILESTYDHIWREIKQHCGLSEEHRRSFNNIYPNLLDEDMDDNTMLNWILDNNIDFDPSEYMVIMDNIADDRKRFVTHQRRMITILREHNSIIEKGWPIKWVIKNKEPIHYEPIATNYDRWGTHL